MKKYILMLLSVSCFGQFNPVQWYEFSKGNYEPNTFIGGIGGTINTRELLAAKLGINVGRIKKFEVIGSDVQCAIINGNYSMLGAKFDGVSSLTYYIDADGLVNTIGGGTFRDTNLNYLKADNIITESGGGSTFSNTQMKNWVAPNLKYLMTGNGRCFFQTNFKRVYIPMCLTIGTTTGADFFGGSLFNGLPSTAVIYTNPYLQTVNSGGLEGDLSGIPQTVVYVTNFNIPNPITDLSTGTITSNSIQVNFTAPTGSTNAIDFYEVWLNGFPYQEISGSGQTITGLATGTSYEIEVKPVDIYYNKSSSNKITVSTL